MSEKEDKWLRSIHNLSVFSTPVIKGDAYMRNGDLKKGIELFLCPPLQKIGVSLSSPAILKRSQLLLSEVTITKRETAKLEILAAHISWFLIEMVIYFLS